MENLTRHLLYAHAVCLCCAAVSAGEADFSAFGDPQPAAETAPATENDWDAFGKTVPVSAPAPQPPPRLWTVNTHPGKTFTEDQLRAMYPGHRFPFPDSPAPEVAGAADPFSAACGAWGCPTTPTTPATGAAPTSTSWPGSSPAGVTFIRAGGAATLGGTSCATGNCAAATYAPRWPSRRW